MAETPTSLESHCLFAVKNVLKDMARAGVFKVKRGGSVDRVREQAIISQFGRAVDTSSLPLPGFVVTYLGHNRSVNAGENNADTGVITILVQFIDKMSNEDDPNANSYFTWLSTARTWLLDGPLESPPESLGYVYHTHISDYSPPAEYDWAVHDQMKMMFTVQAFTKTKRTKETT